MKLRKRVRERVKKKSRESKNILANFHFLKFLINEANENQLNDMIFEVDNAQMSAVREIVKNVIAYEKNFAQKFRETQEKKFTVKRINNFVEKLLDQTAGRALMRNNKAVVKYLLGKGLNLYRKKNLKWQEDKEMATLKPSKRRDVQTKETEDSEDDKSGDETASETEEEEETEEGSEDTSEKDTTTEEDSSESEYYVEGESEEEEEEETDSEESDEEQETNESEEETEEYSDSEESVQEEKKKTNKKSSKKSGNNKK